MQTNAPHGGRLIHRVLRGNERDDALAGAYDYPALRLNARQLSDVMCIAHGVFSPLEGFMTRDDYFGVLDEMRLAAGWVWTLPVVLAVSPETAADVRVGRFVRLENEKRDIVAVMRVEDVFERDAVYEARRVFGTSDASHPGVASLYAEPPVVVGGDLWLIDAPAAAGGAQFAAYTMTPAQTRAEFQRRGWRRIVGFQTRNPVHRAHEYIQKCALEIVDGLLLHPLVGETKADDVPAAVRMRSYEVLIDNYYPPERVLLAAFPAAMRYAGPREAVFHALCRKNYGCTHFIVGRDHAGVGDFYGTYDAQRIFRRFSPAELGITPLFFEHAFYCRKCAGMATSGTCPHGKGHHVTLSGTAVRELLRAGQVPPPEFSRPEVAAVLAETMGEAAAADAT